MKKLLSLSMAAMMLLSTAAIANADTGTIPLSAESLNVPALGKVPTVYTEHKEDKYGRGTTTLWSSVVLDKATVMMYDSSKHYNVPYELDLVDGTSATYSTTGLKRQVGITYSGGYAVKNYDWTWLDWTYIGTWSTKSEHDKLYSDAEAEMIKEWKEKGWKSNEIVMDPIYELAPELDFYVNVNGKDKYVGYIDVDYGMTDAELEAQAASVINYLVQVEQYNEDALTWKYDDNATETGYYDVYAKQYEGLTYHNWNGGDDAYYLYAGNQVSLHGRSGKVYQVAVQADEDLFNTDMTFVDGTVVYKKAGITGDWYVASVTMNYSEESAVRSLTAVYLPTYDSRLQGYTVKIIANGTTYNMDYNAYGGFEVGYAYNASGSYKTTGASSFDWANQSNWKYVRNFSLLSKSKLKSMFTRNY